MAPWQDKFQIPSTPPPLKLRRAGGKFQTMTEIQITKPTVQYDLEERTFQFTKHIILFCKKLPHTISNLELTRQLIRAAGSVGANYIEANEALSKKDFLMRIKICRKEAKETTYWLRLIMETNTMTFQEKDFSLLNEAMEFRKIFSSILNSNREKSGH